MAAVDYYNEPQQCLFEIDGIWVKARCARIADVNGGGWQVVIPFGDLPDSPTKRGLLKMWEQQGPRNVWDKPLEAQFHAAVDDERLKVLTGDTFYF